MVQVGKSSRVELEAYQNKLLSEKTARLETLTRTLIMVDAISRQCGVRLHHRIDKDTLQMMAEKAAEQANQGNLSGWKVFRYGIYQSAAQGIGAVTGFSNAGTAAGGFIGAFKAQEEMRYSLTKTIEEHRLQQLRLLADQHRDEAGRARSALAQMLRMLRETAQEESSSKSAILRS